MKQADEPATGPPPPRRIAIVGKAGGTHIGESLRHAATAQGHEVVFLDADEAEAGSRLVRAVAWRLGRRPIGLERFSGRVADACAGQAPDLVLTTGSGFLSADAVRRIRGLGVVTANYSTDDPWNPGLRAQWHLDALPGYDIVFTPRRANVGDLQRHGCQAVSYLPFGYDQRHAAPPGRPAQPAELSDVLFVGGADRDRVDFISKFAAEGLSVRLAGGYWGRFPATRPSALGLKSPEELRVLTAGAKINLCLVRRANRDGHVMRSLEIGAIGGCMLAEDTTEHRELLGPEGEAVVYFTGPVDAAKKARRLLADEPLRQRLAATLHQRITGGRNTYGDRLATILAVAAATRASAAA